MAAVDVGDRGSQQQGCWSSFSGQQGVGAVPAPSPSLALVASSAAVAEPALVRE